MKFRFHCWVVRHASGRVTVTPIDFPHFAVHAVSLEKATEELVLALDDRISRAHPRRVAGYCQPHPGERRSFEIPALPVWNALQVTREPLHITTLVAPVP